MEASKYHRQFKSQSPSREKVVDWIRCAFNKIHKAFNFDALNNLSYVCDESHSSEQLAILADYLDNLGALGGSKNISPIVLSMLPKEARDPKYDQKVKSCMHACINQALTWSRLKCDRLLVVGDAEPPESIFRPIELNQELTANRVKEMCWELCEHFHVNDYLISELLQETKEKVNELCILFFR